MNMKKVYPIVTLLVLSSLLFSADQKKRIFNFYMNCHSDRIQNLEQGERIVEIGKFFLGTPYVGGTLEGNETEKCVINLDELDCVTFYEQVISLTLISSEFFNADFLVEDAFEKELTKMRYRDGIVDGYLSRLHYSSDWIYENTRNGLFRDITKEIGGIKIEEEINFMSRNPKYYDQLKNNSENLKKIQLIENKLNQLDRFYIPKNKINGEVISKIASGDIIFITSARNGLDYAHTGIALKEGKQLKFLHASSKKKKVVIDESLVNYLKTVKGHTGITVLRLI